jgi:transposase-like protein
MFKAVPKEIKEEILAKVKAGEKVVDLAKQYGISNRTIYAWLSRSVAPQISFGEYNRVRKENEELKRIIGMIALDLEQEKKRKIPTHFRK